MTTSSAADALVVLVTWPASTDLEPFARGLVDARLAACVNILPLMQSVYRWQGRVESEKERLLVIKTTRARLDSLTAHVVEHHPYDVPEVLALPVERGLDAYLGWLTDSTTPTA